MNKFDNARLNLKGCKSGFGYNKLAIEDFITSCEATENQLSTCKIERSLNEKMYEELKRDVNDFLTQLNNGINQLNFDTWCAFNILKEMVGNE